MSYIDEHEIRVRYAETDQMGVAYYANYLVWFEVGRSAFCRSLGFSYAEMEKATGSYLVVAEAYCRYRSPLLYDRTFFIRTWLRELRSRSMTFGYELVDETRQTTYASGETKHVVTDRAGRPKKIPQAFHEILAAAI